MTYVTPEPDRYAPSDPTLCEKLAALLDDPLPADWRDPAAIARRRAQLSVAAIRAGEAAVEAARLAQSAVSVDAPCVGAAVKRFGAVMADLFMGLRKYLHETQRSDGLVIVWETLSRSVGEPASTVIDGILDRLIRESRAWPQDESLADDGASGARGATPAERRATNKATLKRMLSNPPVDGLAGPLDALQRAAAAEGATADTPAVVDALAAVKDAIGSILANGYDVDLMQAVLSSWAQVTGGPVINVSVG